MVNHNSQDQELHVGYILNKECIEQALNKMNELKWGQLNRTPSAGQLVVLKTVLGQSERPQVGLLWVLQEQTAPRLREKQGSQQNSLLPRDCL